MSSSSAVLLHQFGVPGEVVEFGEVGLSSPKEGEVLVEIEAAPINPADINVLEGKYGILPVLPAVPGVEGVGVVRSVGGKVQNLQSGDHVLLPHGFGTWRRWGVLAATDLVVVPPAVPVQQAAMLRINPATALCMLREFVALQPGDWIVQNAANSGVGRSVIQIAKACGWRTVNVVRRDTLVPELLSIGADAVVVDGPELAQRIKEAMNGESGSLGLNAVGGESALAIANTLGEDGKLVTYGAMARQPLRVPNGLLLFKNISFHGFWVTRWYQRASKEAVAVLFASLFEWAGAGVLCTPIEAEYTLAQIRDAVIHAQQAQRSGKVLLRPSR
ncbi:MAG: 2-enoyl thioester reductase domain-containing protein [Verrucomicrobiota bacterium]